MLQGVHGKLRNSLGVPTLEAGPGEMPRACGEPSRAAAAAEETPRLAKRKGAGRTGPTAGEADSPVTAAVRVSCRERDHHKWYPYKSAAYVNFFYTRVCA